MEFESSERPQSSQSDQDNSNQMSKLDFKNIKQIQFDNMDPTPKPQKTQGHQIQDKVNLEIPVVVKNTEQSNKPIELKNLQLIKNSSLFLNPLDQNIKSHNAQFPSGAKDSLKNVLNFKNEIIVMDQLSLNSGRSGKSRSKKGSHREKSRDSQFKNNQKHGYGNHEHSSQISGSKKKKSSVSKSLSRKRTVVKRKASVKRHESIKKNISIKRGESIKSKFLGQPQNQQEQNISDSIKSSSNFEKSSTSQKSESSSFGSTSNSYDSESSQGDGHSCESSSEYQDFNKDVALGRAKKNDHLDQPIPQPSPTVKTQKSIFEAAADGFDKVQQKLDKKRRLAAANSEILNPVQMKTVDKIMTDQGDNFKLDKFKRQTTLGQSRARKHSSFIGNIDFEDEQTLEKTAAHRFDHYKNNFMNLTKRNLIETNYEVLSTMISNDSQRVVCLFCNKEQQQQNFIIVTYDLLKPKKPKQKIQIYGDYLLADEFVQTKKGERYCLPYFDTGNYKIHVFDQYDDKIIRIEDINESLKISTEMDPELGFTTPGIHAIFINQNLLFINVYDQHKKINYHYQYNLKSFTMVGQPVQTNLKKQLLNYPINCFFNNKADEFYVIYRHGQFITFNNIKGLFQAKNEDMAKAFRQSLFGIGKAAPGGNQVNSLLGAGLMGGGISKESKANPLIGLGMANIMKKVDVNDTQPTDIDRHPDGIQKTGTIRENKFYKHAIILHYKNQGLEQCLFFQNQFLVTKHSNSILFFKRDKGLQSENFTLVQGIEKGDVETKQWHLYHLLQVSGYVFYSGPKEMSVTTETKIHFYEFHNDTFEPVLKGLVNNFMACNRMVVGPDQNVILSYQTNQTDFMIYRRSNYHKFISLIDKKPILYCQTLSLGTYELFCISNNTLIEFHDINSYQVIGQIDVLHDKDQQSDQALNVLMMKADETQSTMVCLLGYRLLESKYKVTNICVHSLSQKSETKQSYTIGKHCHSKLKMPDFKCMHFNSLSKFPCEFSTNFEICKKNSRQILISDAVALWSYNYESQQLTLKYEYQQILIKSPDFFVFNEDQTILFVSCTKADHVFKNIKQRSDYDFDIDFKANEIRACINANQKFYVLANKIEGQHGIYLIEFDQNDPSDYSQQEETYVMKWPQKLEIGSADIYFCDYESDSSLKAQSNLVKSGSSKQIVLCFKTIYVNTFTVIVIGLGEGSNNIILRHETFHMWESFVKGLLLPSLDFFILQNQGIKAIKLGYQEKQRKIKDSKGDKVKMHSLHNCDYLKINSTNHILFTYSLDETQVEIHVLDLNRESQKLTSMITEIYKILIEQLNLSELMLLQGLFSCSSQGRLALLISEFPNQPVFFKSLLELDMTNLISILSFDSRSIESLLDDSNKEFFRKDYPVFYKLNDKNQDKKKYFKSAIDVALYNSQIQGLNKILEYIVMYQNSIMHSYLFEDNFIKMLTWDINVIPLLNSKILFEQFDFDQWPNIHHEDTTMIEPYNDSIFNVSQQYPKVFHFLTRCHEDHSATENQGSLVHKIRYTLSILPNMRDNQNDVSLIDVLATTDQIDVFSTKPVQSIIQFKWDRYAERFHKLFASIHMVYLLTFLLYVNEIYINGRFKHQPKMLLLMLVCNMTASFYDLFQLKLTGFIEYFTDIWNYVDILHVYIGYINLYYQFESSKKSQVMQTHVKIFILLSTLMMLIKTFFFLRIVQGLTQFVIMVKQVIADLRYFVFFYLLFVLMFSLVLAVLGIRNKSWEDSDHSEDLDHIDHRQLSDESSFSEQNITERITNMYDATNLILERQIPPMLGNFIQIFRFSLADFDFSIINTSSFTQLDVSLFWISWLLIVLITNIVFLNFIIAEVSNSYANVQCSVKQLILRERASLINESEQMMAKYIKSSPSLFPKFMIIREVDQ